MKWLRFYYFVFLNYYKPKGEDWVPEYRSLFLVQLSIFLILMEIILLLEYYVIHPAVSVFHYRPYLILMAIISLIFLHQILVKNGKSEKIYAEFNNHPLNTARNRRLCWVIWVFCFLLFMITAVLLK